MICKKWIKELSIAIIFLFAIPSCKDSKVDPQGTLNLGITDTRATVIKSSKDIIDASKLSKFEITISKIDLKTSSGGLVNVLGQDVTVDLRNYQGTVMDLASAKIPLGNYSGVVIYISGIVLTYDGNTYTSSVDGATSLVLGDLPGVSFNEEQGVTDLFVSELSVNLSFDFEMSEELNNRTLRIGLDAVSACDEIEFNCVACTEQLQYFVILRPIFQMSIYFEEGIQQIKHSPPLGIELVSGNTAEYYGIHTFVDFNGIGGTINSHTSQHVYRGEDCLISVDAEDMTTNVSVLTPNTISPTGQTDVRADELFDFDAIGANLSSLGHNLESGKTYYFSLRKTWNITTGIKTYDLTRTCEPIPVYWP